MRRTARIRLQQLDAVAVIDQLQPIVNSFYDKAQRFPTGWNEMVQAGLVRGIPLDPTGVESIGDVLLSTDGQSVVFAVRRHLSDLFVVDGLK